MSRTLFIADLHLCQQEPAITAGFLRFYSVKPQNVKPCISWAICSKAGSGMMTRTPLHQQVAEALSALTIPIWFIHGNRDFLLGKSSLPAVVCSYSPKSSYWSSMVTAS